MLSTSWRVYFAKITKKSSQRKFRARLKIAGTLGLEPTETSLGVLIPLQQLVPVLHVFGVVLRLYSLSLPL